MTLNTRGWIGLACYLLAGALSKLAAVYWRQALGCPANGECYRPGWSEYYWLDGLFALWMIGLPFFLLWLWRLNRLAPPRNQKTRR